MGFLNEEPKDWSVNLPIIPLKPSIETKNLI